MPGCIKIGVSSCLLGNRVRYDGGHKYERLVAEVLGAYFTLIPFCPEAECGLGIPREAMQLEGELSNLRLVALETRADHTETMQNYSRLKIQELKHGGLCAIIFKSKSPSCGLRQVKIFAQRGFSGKTGRGIFAETFKTAFSSAPVAEETEIRDVLRRNSFIRAVYAYAQQQKTMLP